MDVLVTGGAGFIGSALVAGLLAAGHRVTVVDDLSTGNPARVDRRAAIVEADVGSADLAGAFATAPEAVFHLAAQSSVGESVRAPLRTAAVNVSATVNLLEQCAAHGVRRFVFGSTGGALYGDPAPLPTPEDHPPSPVSPYGASKAAAESFVAAMSRAAGMRFTILRYANVYGPGEAARASVVTAFCRAVLDGVRPVIHGDGLQQRDYVYVDDVVEANLRALEWRDGGVFNIGTGTARTVRQVFDAVAAAAGYRGGPAFAEARPAEVRDSCLDVRRAQRLLGWSARVPFGEGIQRCLRSPLAAGAPATADFAAGGEARG